jgi:hypothetical protein
VRLPLHKLWKARHQQLQPNPQQSLRLKQQLKLRLRNSFDLMWVDEAEPGSEIISAGLCSFQPVAAIFLRHSACLCTVVVTSNLLSKACSVGLMGTRQRNLL